MISAEDIVARLPEGTDASVERIDLLIDDAMDVIEIELANAGRDLYRDLETLPAFDKRVRIVLQEMVSSMVIAGGRKGIRSVSSTTGPTSDSTTYSDGAGTGWATAFLTAEMRRLLGLTGGARGNFPGPIRWPERMIDARP